MTPGRAGTDVTRRREIDGPTRVESTGKGEGDQLWREGVLRYRSVTLREGHCWSLQKAVSAAKASACNLTGSLEEALFPTQTKREPRGWQSFGQKYDSSLASAGPGDPLEGTSKVKQCEQCCIYLMIILCGGPSGIRMGVVKTFLSALFLDQTGGRQTLWHRSEGQKQEMPRLRG